MKSLGPHPGRCLGRIAQRAVGGMADDDAAIDQGFRRFLRFGRQARHQIGGLSIHIHAGDKQFAGKSVDQQANSFLQAFAAAGRHHDRIRVAVWLFRTFRQTGDEQHQTAEPEQASKNKQPQQASHGLVSSTLSTAALKSSHTATGSTWRGSPSAWVAAPLPVRSRIRRQPAADAASRSLS